MASLAEYVLYLARNKSAAEEHRTRDSAEKAMTKFGLDEKQREIIHSADPNRISRAIQDEFAPESNELMYVTMSCNLKLGCPPK